MKEVAMIFNIIFLITFGCAMNNVIFADDLSIQSMTGVIETSHAHIWYTKFYTQACQDKMPLICLHGGPGFSHHCMLQLQAIAQSRPVILYDQSGCGNSKIKDSSFSDWSLQHYLAELDEVINQLGYEKVFLLGSSWGGTLAAQYALTHQDKLAGLVLASPLINTHDWVTDCKRLAATLPLDVYETLMYHEAQGTTHEDAYQQAIMVFYHTFTCRLNPWPVELLDSCNVMNLEIYQMMWGSSEMNSTGTLKDFDMIDQLSKITVPTLMTCGRYDTATPESMQKYVEFLPHGSLVVFEESGHMTFAEEPALYMQVVTEFLQTIEN